MEFCLVYISSSNELSTQQLQEILATSQQNNRSLGIAGVLLYCNGNIIQVLEGEEQKVKGLYDVIARDQRHYQVIKLYGSQIKQRSFGDWLMGYKTLTNVEMDALAEQFPFIKNPYVKADTDNLVTSLVQTFYKNNHRN